jgi:hypothetical protein
MKNYTTTKEYQNTMGISDDLLNTVLAVMNEKKLDSVDKDEVKKDFDDRDDKDIDNDGDSDSSDKFLHNKRKAITKAVAKEEKDEDKPYKKGGKPDDVKVDPKDEDEDKEGSCSESTGIQKLVAHRKKLAEMDKHNRPQDKKNGEKATHKQGTSELSGDPLKFKKKINEEKVGDVLAQIKKAKGSQAKLKLANSARKLGATPKQLEAALSEGTSSKDDGTMLVVEPSGHKVKRIKKTEWNQYKKKGWNLAEEVLDEAAMTRQHFQEFANGIKRISNSTERSSMAEVAAEIFAQSNPRFNKAKFMQACNAETER